MTASDPATRDKTRNQAGEEGVEVSIHAGN
ncbi:hypothetical protein DES53_102887 [Roseimicrobium gellanilyticum]|uniref:Uncharacterized protein n=1 Tax=Roseimicrobium gellanilyticum TaxID=748857 RepID=A0A366HSL9_9BACT|nr:hypothetical protein DES53_102887 [Roseimicrobium gellanilyticum]